MRTDPFRLCPACGTRNKPTREFCARCAESLHGLAPMTPADLARSRALRRVDADEGGGGGTLGGLGRAIVTLAALGAVAAVALGRFGGERIAPDRISPDVFAQPSDPQRPEVPAAPVTGRGAADFEDGRRLLVRGQAAEAIPLLARAVEADSTNPLYRFVYGQAFEATGQSDEAAREMDAAASLAPADPYFQREVARGLSRLGRIEPALTAYRRALDLEPDRTALVREASDLLVRAGRPGEALPLLERAAFNSSDLLLKQELGEALEKSGSLDRAAEVYDGILAVRPDAHITRGRLAEVRILQGRPDEAVAIFQAGLDADAAAPLLHRGKASALERAGRYDEAAASYREYARLAPQAADANALLQRATLLEQRTRPAS